MNQPELYVALDLGSNSVKCVIGEVADENTIHVIGVGVENSSGINKGNIVNIDATVASIKRAVAKAERMMGMTVNKVILGIPANQCSIQDVKGVVAVNGDSREISDDDLDRVLESAATMLNSPDHEVVNQIPKKFTVDNLTDIKDPRGMLGIRLEVDSTLISSSKTVLHNILRCVERAGLDVQQIYLKAMTSGNFALTDDEKSRGTMLLDMGAESTTLSVFKEDILTNVAMIPLGGDNLVKDLSGVLKIDTSQARELLYDYGRAYCDEKMIKEGLTVPVVGIDFKEQFALSYIVDILQDRLSEIFNLVLDELYNQGVEDLPGGIVLTGGVANLDGIQKFANEHFNSRVRIASPTQMGARNPELTGAIGVIQYAFVEGMFYGEFSDEAPLEPIQQGNNNYNDKRTKMDQDQSEEPKQGVMVKLKDMFNRFID